MIIRRRHTANFTTIGNVLFEDERLAADEVGILAYLLSRPHDWEVRRSALMRRWGMGREAIKRVIGNWVRTGWCWPIKTRLPNGTYYMIYEIRDQPGPSLTDEDVRRALSLVSSEAASDDIDAQFRPEDAPDRPPPTGDPPTGYPSLADPALADPYVAKIDILNTDLQRTESDQKPEREGARAREKHALNLVEFKRRWPTNASDNQAKVDKAWFTLTMEKGEAALAGITPFLDNNRRLGRKTVPAGFTYLGEERWALLEQQATAAKFAGYPRVGVEAKAIAVLHDIVGAGDFFLKAVQRGDRVYYHLPVTPRLAALAQAPAAADWVTLEYKQAGAWESFLAEHLTLQTRHRLREGSRAPWPWPPRKDGTLTPTGPPEAGLSDEDVEDFR